MAQDRPSCLVQALCWLLLAFEVGLSSARRALLAHSRHAFNTGYGEQVPFRTAIGCEVSRSARRAPRVRGVMGTPPPPRASHRVGIRRADVGGSKRRSAPYKALGPAGAADRAGRGESSEDPRAQAGERSTADSCRYPRPDCQDPQRPAVWRLGKAVFALLQAGTTLSAPEGGRGCGVRRKGQKSTPKVSSGRGQMLSGNPEPYWAPTPGEANQSELRCSFLTSLHCNIPSKPLSAEHSCRNDPGD